MIRIIRKLFPVAVLLFAFMPAAPVWAAGLVVAYVSSTGNDSNPCTAALPCETFFGASIAWDGTNGDIACLNFPSVTEPNVGFTGASVVTIDCTGVLNAATPNSAALSFESNDSIKIRNLTMNGQPGGSSAIQVTGSGTLILENCVFENFTGTAIEIEPTGPFNLVMINSRISNNASGVVIKPAAGGSVTATFDGVTIGENSGGGIKTDTTNGPVRLDISNSTISNNSGNGMNAVGGVGGANMLNLFHDVIASNGDAGIQANGANAAALIDTTLLDSNAAGALAAIGSGRILTYGNNRIVGSAGTGFTGPAALQ
jgi:hypothetical protein